MPRPRSDASPTTEPTPNVSEFVERDENKEIQVGKHHRKLSGRENFLVRTYPPVSGTSYYDLYLIIEQSSDCCASVMFLHNVPAGRIQGSPNDENSWLQA